MAFAPLPVKLWPGKVREPDLMFMAASHADRMGEYWIIDPEAKTVAVLRLVGSSYAEAAQLTEFDSLTSPQFPGWGYALGDMFAAE